MPRKNDNVLKEINKKKGREKNKEKEKNKIKGKEKEKGKGKGKNKEKNIVKEEQKSNLKIEEIFKDNGKDKVKKSSKSMNLGNKKPAGPPDISNHNAIIKVFKSIEAYEAFRNRYLFNTTSYTPDNDDKSIEILRNRCKNKKKKQENMFHQAIKNKNSLCHNDKLLHSIFRERDYYNNYSKEKLDYEAAGKLLRESSEEVEEEEEEEIMKYVNDNDMDLKKGFNNSDDYRRRGSDKNTVISEVNEANENNEEEKKIGKDNEERGEEEEEEEEKKEKEEESLNKNSKSYSGEKIEIAEDINSNMIEKNSSYKSFSFNDALKPTESHRSSHSNEDSFGNNSKNSRTSSSIFSSTPTNSSGRVPLCMEDVVNSGSVKLPVIQPRYKKDWQALNVDEVIEQRSSWNPYNSTEPKSKIIIPGISKQYQRFIPIKNGNNFWRICDGNTYENLF